MKKELEATEYPVKTRRQNRELSEGRLRLRWALILFAAFILAVAVVDAFRCADGFLTIEYEVSSAKIEHEVRLVMVSDLHETEYGEGNSELLTAITALDPDAILVNGDMLSAKTDEAGAKIGIDLITALTDIAPVYLSLGNHEQGYMKYNGMGLWEKLYATGAVILDRRFVDIELNGQTFRLGGIADYCFNHYYKPAAYRRTASYVFMTGFCDTELFKLLMCHMPENYVPHSKDLVYEDWDCDLVLSGHTHGGLWRLPVIGAPYLPGQGLFPKFVRGRYDVGNAEMIVGAGLSQHNRMPRLGDPAELLLIRLVPETEADPQ